MFKDTTKMAEDIRYDKVYINEYLADDEIKAALLKYFKLESSELIVSAHHEWLNQNLFGVKLVCEIKRMETEFSIELHFIQLTHDKTLLPTSLDQVAELGGLLDSHVVVKNMESSNRYIYRLVRGKGDHQRVHVSPGRLDKFGQVVIDEYLDD
jgi:hypothetical protein